MEVFVAGEEGRTFDSLVLEVRDGSEKVATKREEASAFAGSFRFESAPVGTFRAKVLARSGDAVVLEAPAAEIRVTEGQTSGVWVRVNERPAEDDDGDLVRNGEDPCPLVADEPAGDGDGDGSANACDNCPDISNPAQADADDDGIGDACDLPDPGGGDPVPYAVLADTFESKCALATCHATLAPAADLTLTAEAGYAELVDVPSMQQPALDRVEPGEPAASYLLRKLTGDPSISGEPQPPAPLEPLSAAEIELVTRWIEDGAVP